MSIPNSSQSAFGNEAGIPIFLYEDSASAPHRVNLAAIRKGQFEGMAEKVKDPQWTPISAAQRFTPPQA